jgi:hypothetical protein
MDTRDPEFPVKLADGSESLVSRLAEFLVTCAVAVAARPLPEESATVVPDVSENLQ